MTSFIKKFRNIKTLGAFGLLLFLVGTPSHPQAEEIFQEITVQPGDTLWGIANKYLKDPRRWNEIVQHNKLPTADPTLALPGTRIKVPIQLIKEEFRNAELIRMIPEVRVQNKGSSEWRQAKPNMILKYEDSLRTLEGGEAQVRFPTKEVVQINENSYVILRPEKILQEVQLLKGDLRASQAKVIMPGGTIVKPRGSGSDYSAKVRDDQTEVVFVYKGKVDVTAQGKTITVPEGFGTEVPKSAPPRAPRPLPEFFDFNPGNLNVKKSTPKTQIRQHKGIVKLNAPNIDENLGKKREGSSKAMVSNNLLSKYKIQVAKDEKFTEILLDNTKPIGTEFDINKQKLPDGQYFYRVAFIDALGSIGDFSDSTSISKDTAPPKIVQFHPDNGRTFSGPQAFCDVTGIVEGASSLSINGEVIFISPSGAFQKLITLKEGENVLTLEALDVMGNRTVEKRTVTYKRETATSTPQPPRQNP